PSGGSGLTREITLDSFNKGFPGSSRVQLCSYNRGLTPRPVFCRSDPPCNRGMRVKEPFHESGRCAFGEILVGELVHRRNKRLDAGNRLKSIAVGLALVET